jgi:hypothetical protein
LVIRAHAVHPCRGIAAVSDADRVSTTSPEFGRAVDRRWLLSWDLVACGAEIGVLKLLRDS